ncbi:fungal-specific transcription factor domain-containing protein [Cercophora samala]|uniref:Fungal-specific transcription factor domain-containing protein n=1 Tax=Cercophora samala TaxID=330535 RepID=A0AA40D3U2_9PEZI|nr:fungal-specific transcription factor domain-containing protein [Cercophora samala]
MDPERRNERAKRRKISLACEPCRERKSRCDGAKPICSTCQRRSLPLHRCVYTVENARTASNEAYIRVLHERIRRLERACSENGISTPALDAPEPDLTPGPGTGSETGTGRRSVSAQPAAVVVVGGNGMLTPAIKDHVQCTTSTTTTTTTTAAVVGAPVPHRQLMVVDPRSPDCEGLDSLENATRITAMGTVSAEHDVNQAFEETQDEFYGSSSAASFMKEAYGSVKPQPSSRGQGQGQGQVSCLPTLGTGSSSSSSVLAFAAAAAPKPDFGPLNFLQPDRFALPPRNVADYLVGRFFDRVYWLYPFFHKPTFMHAYHQLWESPVRKGESPPGGPEPGLGLGLGSEPGAGAGSIVFHSALNTIFAIGCQFSDLSARDRVGAIETFLERAKKFVGLDLIDMHNVGVVQSLLLMTLLLQSTPFPSRCWNSLGVAGRVAQGLGLHTEAGRRGRSELEREVRRRTWHGCVILDIIVSMTFGRPTMTDVNDLLLPSKLELVDDEWSGIPAQVDDEVAATSRMNFFIDHIRQCHILGEILSSIYLSPKGRGAPGTSSRATRDESPLYGLDAILELDAKLSRHEAAVCPIMSWTEPSDISGMPEDKKKIIVTQRNVLHASFLYVRLMLHRPILTQLCSNSDSGTTEPTSPVKHGPFGGNRMLYASFAAECAKICLGSAMDLIELVSRTYQTDTTGGWWWDGLYAFTGGLAVIVAYLCPSVLDSLDQRRLERSWVLCQEILAHFASFSISAHRSLKLMQKVHGDVMARVAEQAGDTARPVLPTPIATAATPADNQGITLPREDGFSSAQAHHTSLDFGNGLQWQVPNDGDLSMLNVTSLFNWDQPLDFFTGGLGTDNFP